MLYAAKKAGGNSEGNFPCNIPSSEASECSQQKHMVLTNPLVRVVDYLSWRTFGNLPIQFLDAKELNA